MLQEEGGNIWIQWLIGLPQGQWLPTETSIKSKLWEHLQHFKQIKHIHIFTTYIVFFWVRNYSQRHIKNSTSKIKWPTIKAENQRNLRGTHQRLVSGGFKGSSEGKSRGTLTVKIPLHLKGSPHNFTSWKLTNMLQMLIHVSDGINENNTRGLWVYNFCSVWVDVY